MGKERTTIAHWIDGQHNWPPVYADQGIKKNIKIRIPPPKSRNCFMQMRFLVIPRISYAGRSSLLQAHSLRAKEMSPFRGPHANLIAPEVGRHIKMKVKMIKKKIN